MIPITCNKLVGETSLQALIIKMGDGIDEEPK